MLIPKYENRFDFQNNFRQSDEQNYGTFKEKIKSVLSIILLKKIRKENLTLKELVTFQGNGVAFSVNN